MAVRIQLRRDTASNWSTNNPILRPGEVGIETDTLKFKIGPAVVSPAIGTAWNSITSYANVVPSDLNTTLNGYLETNDIGAVNGVVGLNGDQDALIPGESIIFEGATADAFETTLTVTDPTADRTITLPDATGTVALTSDLTTTNVTEGTNLYYTDERAQDAVAAALAAGTHTNITVTYNDNSNSISLTGATTYSNEDAVDAVAGALAAGTHTNISVSYNDNANSISLTGAVTYTDENAQDAVGNAVGNGLDYDDNTGAISVDPSEFALSAVGAPTGNVDLATYKITNLGTPTSSGDAATKAYVDNTTAGLNFHAAVHAATTANLDATYANGTSGVGATLTANANGALVVDGHTLNADERVLVKNQTAGAQNGIYVVTATGDGSNPYILTRATDADNNPTGEVAYGDFTFVQNGTANAGFGYIVNTTGTITMGTTAISYVQFNAGQVVVAGNGLTESTPGTLAINTAVTVDLNTAQTLTNKTITGTFTGNITGNVTGDVSGNAGTVTNGVYTTGSYADPAWITSLAASKVGLGNVENTALSTWAGSANITTLGTVATGTWNATTIATTRGGTGLTSYATGDILYASATNTLAKLAAGTNGHILTLSSGVPTWAAAPISLPSQTGNSGKYLTTDGTSASWADTPITRGTVTITTNTATTVDTISSAQAAEYTLCITQGIKIRTSKVIVNADHVATASADMTEFAITETNGTISGVLVTATYGSGAELKVTITDAASSNATVKFTRVTF